MRWRYVALVVAVAVFFIILLAIFPHEIYDNFLWKYFIGPVVADARGHPVEHNGVWAHEGYSMISEIVYGIFMVIFIYLIYLFFERFGVVVNLKFMFSSMPFIIYGSVGRVLEDAGAFEKPLSYLFISPLIYIQVGILFVISILCGIYLKEKKKIAYLFLGINVFYILFYLISFPSSSTLHPLFFVIFSLLSLWIYISSDMDYNSSLLSFGSLALLSSLCLLLLSIGDRHPNFIILISPLIALAVATATFSSGKFLNIKILKEKVNLLLIFGHMLDGITTYFAVINPFGWKISYGEKHPLPDFLMKNFYGIGYPLLKFLVIIGVIYAVDDLKENLKNTIKFFILFLGLSPGMRDLLRILIGV